MQTQALHTLIRLHRLLMSYKEPAKITKHPVVGGKEPKSGGSTATKSTTSLRKGQKKRKETYHSYIFKVGLIFF